MKVLSFGCGVQSVTIAAMCCLGEFEMPDFAVFADPQWESQKTYDYLKWFTPWAKEHGLEIITATKGNIREDALNSSKQFASMPLWTRSRTIYGRDSNGKKGKLRRQCTNEYKIQVVRKVIRERAGIEKGKRWKGDPCEIWIGISEDEIQRQKPSRDKFAVHRWPLLEKEMRRSDCINWLHKHDLPIPPKSACIGCPFHDNKSWREMKSDRTVEWLDAIDFDRRIRETRVAIKNPVFLHKDAVELEKACLGIDQIDHFGNECTGFCGN